MIRIMNIVLLLLAGVTLLQICTLILMSVRQRHDGAAVQNVTIDQARTLRAIFKVHGLLSSMQWNLDILVDGDCGKTNLCQKEFLHNVADECKAASQTMAQALTGLRSVLTSQFLRECEAQAEEAAAAASDSGRTTVTTYASPA